MTDKTMPDELYAVPVNNGYIASPHRTEPHDTKYHHHRIVEAQQAETERLREREWVLREALGIMKGFNGNSIAECIEQAEQELQTQKED